MLISQSAPHPAVLPSQGASKHATEVVTPQASHATQHPIVQVQDSKVPDSQALDSKAPDSKVKEAVDVANRFMKTLSQNLEFSIDADTNKTVVKVIDTTTNEVVKQFPSQEMLDIARALDRLQGVLHKTKA